MYSIRVEVNNMNLAAILLLSFFLSGLASGRPQLDFGDEETEEYYDEGEYFYQEYDENGEDLGYYSYNDESEDYGMER